MNGDLIITGVSYLLAQASLLEKVRPYLPNILLVLGIGLLSFFLLRRNSNFLRRRGSSDPVKEVRDTRALLGERSRDSALSDAPVEVLRWQVEMHATARDLKAEIDSKILTLQALLKEVRAERQRLEAVIEQAKVSRMR